MWKEILPPQDEGWDLWLSKPYIVFWLNDQLKFVTNPPDIGQRIWLADQSKSSRRIRNDL